MDLAKQIERRWRSLGVYALFAFSLGGLVQRLRLRRRNGHPPPHRRS
jgi:hypothetical protein